MVRVTERWLTSDLKLKNSDLSSRPITRLKCKGFETSVKACAGDPWSVRYISPYFLCSTPTQGRIQDFKLGGAALKIIAPSRGRREIFWGISCEKLRFYAKKSYFFQF